MARDFDTRDSYCWQAARVRLCKLLRPFKMPSNSICTVNCTYMRYECTLQFDWPKRAIAPPPQSKYYISELKFLNY